MIPKSRYDTIDCYLASAEYNDKEVQYDPEVFKELIDGGMDLFIICPTHFAKPPGFNSLVCVSIFICE